MKMLGMSSAACLFLVCGSLVAIANTAAATCSNVTTFNADLATSVESYWDRRQLIPGALAAEGSDVFCLQGMWYEDDMREVIDALQDVYPHHYSDLHTDKDKLEDDSWAWFARSACSASELSYLVLYLLPCAYSQGCISVFEESSDAGMGCLASKCNHILKEDSVGPKCLSCLAISASSVSDISDRCHKVFGSDLRLNAPGLLLLSKKQLSNETSQLYFEGYDMTLQRGYLQAEVQDIGTVVCTHLTHAFPYYWEYDLPFSSYEEQNMAEINATHERLGSSNHILAGTLNTGKAVCSSDPEKNLQEEAAKSYDLLTFYNYDMDTYLLDDGRCTLCESNPLVSNHSFVVDDVLIMGNAFTSVTKKRVLDQTDPVLSDHFGVQATVCN